MHKKSICHLIAHIAYIGLYGVLITFTIFLYNFANLVILLYAGWIILAFGIVFCYVMVKQITKERTYRKGY